ncbi:MAG: sensor histidine kinase [Candidatus Neomarinimicrobiota bacterium]|nr:MAG: sensor histidine kinase [Candidatus Neomarinimicrobiota bacterium]
MKWIHHTGNIKGGLFLLGLILIAGLLLYSQSLVQSLREDNRRIAGLYAELITTAVAEQDDANLDFIFEHIIKKVRFPVIQSDPEGRPVSWRNLPEESADSTEILALMHTMDRQNPPLPLQYTWPGTGEKVTFGYLHFGDSRLIQQLIWLPYIEIGAVAVFILLGFVGFSVIRNNEKRFIWVGMARETAHQLGTPVSSLLGWIDWLETHPRQAGDVLGEMKTDLNRLERINERFSRMGSEPTLEETDLSACVADLIAYFERRIPNMGKSIQIINEIEPGLTIQANGTLLSWAIENLIKNGLDAIEQSSGEIRVKMQREDGMIILAIRDTGKGIPKKEWKNIFRPGFSTKSRGWGLGLSLTKRIIEDLHGGKVYVASSEPGTGTEFRIQLPQ